jgi:hypothetical protein
LAEIEGMRQLRARLAAIGDTEKMMGYLGQIVVGEAKINTRPFRKTGNLGRSIRVDSVTRSSVTVIAGGSGGVGYARFVEQGTGIYGPKKRKIVPKHAKMLSWVSGGSRLTGKGPGSTRKFARSVRGRKATPYFVPAAETILRKAGVTRVVVKAWNDAA